MGGMNHQPCKTHLPKSTRLSRVVSLAYAQLMLANATLEDALIGELEGQGASETFAIWTRSRDQFRELVTCLGRVVEAFTASIDDMDGNPFQHVQVLHAMDVDELKRRLTAASAVNPDDQTFDLVGSSLKLTGFEGVFRQLKARYESHLAEARKLLHVFEDGERHARTGMLLQLIEANELPFRLQFARVMNPLTETMQMFSYSSLISIEVHYRSSHCSPGTSLLQEQRPSA